MDSPILERPDASQANRGQVCPLCHLPALSAVERTVRGITMADYLCVLGHAWFSKWVAA